MNNTDRSIVEDYFKPDNGKVIRAQAAYSNNKQHKIHSSLKIRKLTKAKSRH